MVLLVVLKLQEIEPIQMKISVFFQCITMEEGEELEDFLVEINILVACSHPNIVGLYACYYHDHKLSVSVLPLLDIFM